MFFRYAQPSRYVIAVWARYMWRFGRLVGGMIGERDPAVKGGYRKRILPIGRLRRRGRSGMIVSLANRRRGRVDPGGRDRVGGSMLSQSRWRDFGVGSWGIMDDFCMFDGDRWGYGDFVGRRLFSDLRIYPMVIGGQCRFYLMRDGSIFLFNFGAQFATSGYKFPPVLASFYSRLMGGLSRS